MEDMKEEVAKRPRLHEIAVPDKKKDQVIAGYLSRTKRCSRALDLIQKAWTSPNVVIEVIRDLIVDIIN